MVCPGSNVIGFEHIATGRAEQERVVKQADHIQLERFTKRNLDIQRLHEFMPADAGDDNCDGKHAEGQKQVSWIGRFDQTDDADVYEWMRDCNLIIHRSRVVDDVNISAGRRISHQ